MSDNYYVGDKLVILIDTLYSISECYTPINSTPYRRYNFNSGNRINKFGEHYYRSRNETKVIEERELKSHLMKEHTSELAKGNIEEYVLCMNILNDIILSK